MGPITQRQDAAWPGPKISPANDQNFLGELELMSGIGSQSDIDCEALEAQLAANGLGSTVPPGGG